LGVRIYEEEQFKCALLQLRAKWENWMMGGIHECNKTGQMKRPSYKDIGAWIVEIWAAVNEKCVRNVFIKPRGDEAVSGDSDYVHDTFSEMEAVSGDSDYVHDDTFSEMEAEEQSKWKEWFVLTQLYFDLGTDNNYMFRPLAIFRLILG
jgi:hypothetical protein